MCIRDSGCTGRDVHSLEAWIVHPPAVQRVDGVDADSEQTVGTHLIKRNNVGMNFYDIHKEVFVAHPGQPVFLGVGGEARHVLDLGFLQPDDVTLRLGGERRLGKEFRPRE